FPGPRPDVVASPRYSLIPAVCMIFTTPTALAWQVYFFTKAVVDYLNGSSSGIFANVRAPINKAPCALVALGINAVFVVIGAVLFLVGLSMAIRLFRSYLSSKAEARVKAPAAAAGGTRER